MNPITEYQKQIQSQWDSQKMYELYMQPENTNQFIFIDGPPFINSSTLHIGHCAISSIKSAVLNYKSMTGFQCNNKLGYDCHGLPIESIAIKELGITTLQDLERIGIAEFNAFCKSKIAEYEGGWQPIYTRLGRWLDYDNSYKTMDKNFMESVWWAFGQLFTKGLIYRGYKITPYSYSLQSAVSNFEASQNYKDVDCRSLYIRFLINHTIKTSSSSPQSNLSPLHTILTEHANVYIIAWTTTPWTLLANIALCINSTLDYDIVQIDPNDANSDIYILGKDTISNIISYNASSANKDSSTKYKILTTVKGSQLVGYHYKPLYNTYSNLKLEHSQEEDFKTNTIIEQDKWFSILADDFVKPVETTNKAGATLATSPGTSIVHLAPVFGEDDYRVCKEQNLITEKIIPILEVINKECIVLPTPHLESKYHNKLILDTETDIIKDLKTTQTLVRIQQIRHEYPYCYRTDTPLIYRTYESFYVDIQAIKSRMLTHNASMNWYPEHIGKQRFHNWLETARDWCISRSRYFGTPIPVWISEDGQDYKVISSIEELQTLTGRLYEDIHPEFVNDATFTITNTNNGKTQTYRRVPDIFDCWFESGAVPFAQNHYPFNTTDTTATTASTTVEMTMPIADFIVEGLDQTRGWFYTLLVLSTALFDSPPAKNVMTVGLILDEHKKKISKKTKNFVDPLQLIDNYGADAIRLYLLQSQITNAEPLPFKEDELRNFNKELFRFKNTIAFLNEHITNLQHQGHIFNPTCYLEATAELNPMDKWIITLINTTTTRITAFMEQYNISKSVRLVLDIIEDITNWYLKFNRDRFKGKTGLVDWQLSLSVLFQVIRKYTVLLAPFAPFLATWTYDSLQSMSMYATSSTSSTSSRNSKNVFQEKYSDLIQLDITTEENKECLDTFALLQRIARMTRSARTRTITHTSNKTPIKSCNICMDSLRELELISRCIELIQSELNIIDISYKPLSGNIKYKIIANKQLIGKKYRQQAKLLTNAIEMTESNKINSNGEIEINLASQNNDKIDTMYTYIITKEEYMLEPQFGTSDIYDNTSNSGILIQLDFTYDQTIENMAILKRFIADVQQTRKHLGLRPWNQILVEIIHDDFNIISNNLELIKQRLECNVSSTPSHITSDIFTFKPFEDDETITTNEDNHTITNDSRLIQFQIIRLE